MEQWVIPPVDVIDSMLRDLQVDPAVIDQMLAGLQVDPDVIDQMLRDGEVAEQELAASLEGQGDVIAEMLKGFDMPTGT